MTVPATINGRSNTKSAGTDQPLRKPTPGVYTYNTVGFETFTGSRHDYPDRTHAIVRSEEGCLWSFTHEVIEEHTDAYSSCAASEELTMAGWFLRREFLGMTLDETYECAGDPLFSRSGISRESIEFACQADDEDRIEVEGHRRSFEELTIGGQRVRAVHLRLRGVMSGNPDGEVTADVWLDPDSGLRVRERRVADADVRAGVSGQYHEEVEFRLSSLSPLT